MVAGAGSDEWRVGGEWMSVEAREELPLGGAKRSAVLRRLATMRGGASLCPALIALLLWVIVAPALEEV